MSLVWPQWGFLLMMQDDFDLVGTSSQFSCSWLSRVYWSRPAKLHSCGATVRSGDDSSPERCLEVKNKVQILVIAVLFDVHKICAPFLTLEQCFIWWYTCLWLNDNILELEDESDCLAAIFNLYVNKISVITLVNMLYSFPLVLTTKILETESAVPLATSEKASLYPVDKQLVTNENYKYWL